MRQAELSNWSLDAGQMADLCSSINQFFTATGVIPPQGAAHSQPQVQHPTAPGAPQHGAMHRKAGQHGQHISTGQVLSDVLVLAPDCQEILRERNSLLLSTSDAPEQFCLNFNDNN